MTEFVEDRFNFVVRQQRGLIRLRRGKITYERADRALVTAIRQEFALDDPELGKMIIFAITRIHIEIEQAHRLARFGIGH